MKTNEVYEARFERFLRGYIECALWSSMDQSDEQTGGDPMDKNYSRMT